MRIGSLVWIRRRDINEYTGKIEERTIGKGMVMALTSSFARVFGKDGDYAFDEYFPLTAKRCWLVAA